MFEHQIDFVRCPKCGRKHERRPGNDAIYRCSRCDVQFDNDPDEGDDYSMSNPAARLERQEREREQKLRRLRK